MELIDENDLVFTLAKFINAYLLLTRQEELSEFFGEGLELGLTLAMEHPEYARAFYPIVKSIHNEDTINITSELVEMLVRAIPLEGINDPL